MTRHVKLNMLPYKAVDHISDCCSTDSEHSAKPYCAHSPWYVELANLSNIIWSQYCIAIFITAFQSLWVKTRSVFVAFRRTAFCGHVRRIVFGCSKEEVIWINTSRIVALVAHKQSVRDVSVGEHPSHAMSRSGFVIDTEGSVSFASFPSKPQPTLVWSSFVNAGPKLCGRLCALAFSFAWHRTVFGPSVNEAGLYGLKLFAAPLARLHHACFRLAAFAYHGTPNAAKSSLAYAQTAWMRFKSFAATLARFCNLGSSTQANRSVRTGRAAILSLPHAQKALVSLKWFSAMFARLCDLGFSSSHSGILQKQYA